MSQQTAVKKNVLVIEDDPSVGVVLEARLASIGHEVHLERTGREGLTSTIARRPDLVILDLGLPDIGGYEVCEQLRRRFGSSLPILILTAFDHPKSQMRGFACGADAYLTKPYSFQELLDTLRLLLAAKRPEL